MPEYSENDASALRIATLMASAVLSRGGVKPDEQQLAKLTKRISEQPAFGLLREDPRAARLMKAGRGSDLCALFAEKDRKLNGPRGPYARPAFMAKEDASFLKTASGSIRDGEAEGSPARIEREGKLLSELTKRMDQAQSLMEKGIPLSEKEASELVTAAKRYNDGGTGIPGGRREARFSKQAMCVLSRYMPQDEFSNYCGRINAARGARTPADRGYVDPKNYTPDLLSGEVRTAKDLMADVRRSLSAKMTVEGCAAAAAIQKLSNGNPEAFISRKQLNAETASYKRPDSAFMQVMNDPTARGKLASLASKGLAGKLGSSLIEESRRASQEAARWQIGQAASAAAAGRGSKQNMAELLAAKELMAGADPAALVTKEAFDRRAESIAATPAFGKLSQKYDSDPAYRINMDKEIASGDKDNKIQMDYRWSEAELNAQAAKREAPAAER